MIFTKSAIGRMKFLSESLFLLVNYRSMVVIKRLFFRAKSFIKPRNTGNRGAFKVKGYILSGMPVNNVVKQEVRCSGLFTNRGGCIYNIYETAFMSDNQRSR